MFFSHHDVHVENYSKKKNWKKALEFEASIYRSPVTWITLISSLSLLFY